MTLTKNIIPEHASPMPLKYYLDKYAKAGDVVKIVQGYDLDYNYKGILRKNAEIWTIPSYDANELKLSLNSIYGTSCDPSRAHLAKLLLRQVNNAYIHEEIGEHDEVILTNHEIYMDMLTAED